uniref:Uncharacterized protein n=1 Tax=Aegilops tauschii TaxID=37682 RepID=R7VZW6_AEGTA
MALRNLATRMRSPAAAVLRPRVSPPPLRFRLFSSLEGSILLKVEAQQGFDKPS